MTEQDLIKANEVKQEIEELENFIRKAEKVWEGKIIKRDSKYIFKSKPYGIIDSAEYNLDYELKEEILDVLRSHLKKLKEELESM